MVVDVKKALRTPTLLCYLEALFLGQPGHCDEVCITRWAVDPKLHSFDRVHRVIVEGIINVFLDPCNNVAFGE